MLLKLKRTSTTTSLKFSDVCFMKIYFILLPHSNIKGVRRGGGQGWLLPPQTLTGQGRPKIVCFQTFWGKIVYFLLFFRQKVGSCPLENVCPPLEKSLRTAMSTILLLSRYEAVIFVVCDVDKRRKNPPLHYRFIGCSPELE